MIPMGIQIMSLKLKVKSYGWDGGGGSCVVSPSPKNWALCSFIIVLIGECWNDGTLAWA